VETVQWTARGWIGPLGGSVHRPAAMARSLEAGTKQMRAAGA